MNKALAPLFAGVLMLLPAAAALAADAPRPAAPYEPLLGQAYSRLGERGVDEFMLALGFITPDVGPDHQVEVREKLTGLVTGAGKYDGFGICGAKVLTPRVVEVYTFAYFERRPVLISIYLYYFNGHWHAERITVGEDLEKVLETLPMTR